MFMHFPCLFVEFTEIDLITIGESFKYLDYMLRNFEFEN